MKKALLIILLLSCKLAIAQYTFKSLDLVPGATGSYPEFITAIDNKLYFFAKNSGGNYQPWVSDGTTAGSFMLSNVSHAIKSVNILNFVPTAHGVVFLAQDATNGEELWVTDGTSAGTHVIKNINPGTGSIDIMDYAVLNSNMIFQANDGTHGVEVWTTDGTDTGTVMLKDIAAGNLSSNPSGFYTYNNKVYFGANDAVHGAELWMTDGTDTGTNMLMDINSGAGSSSPYLFQEANSYLFFRADDGSHGNEPWSTDGTSINTHIIMDTDPSGNCSGSFAQTVGNNVFFDCGDKLWVTDLTSGGTKMVKSVAGDASLTPTYPAAYNGKLYFSAMDTAGNELWVSDGTDTGTYMVKDIDQQIAGGKNRDSDPFSITTYNNKMYFTATTYLAPLHLDLYTSDGTASGTNSIAPWGAFKPEAMYANYSTMRFAELNGWLYFSAEYDGIGPELWALKDVPDAISPVVKAAAIRIYPNPSGGSFVLDCSNTGSNKGLLTVYDMTGKQVYRQNITDNRTTINIPGLAKGIYQLQLRQNELLHTQKLVVQ